MTPDPAWPLHREDEDPQSLVVSAGRGLGGGLQPIPPGPGNPLGTRWMGLNVRGIGIHGTPDASSIGYSRSHGCVRLLPREAEWLFRRARVGTPVLIVAA